MQNFTQHELNKISGWARFVSEHKQFTKADKKTYLLIINYVKEIHALRYKRRKMWIKNKKLTTK